MGFKIRDDKTRQFHSKVRNLFQAKVLLRFSWQENIFTQQLIFKLQKTSHHMIRKLFLFYDFKNHKSLQLRQSFTESLSISNTKQHNLQQDFDVFKSVTLNCDVTSQSISDRYHKLKHLFGQGKITINYNNSLGDKMTKQLKNKESILASELAALRQEIIVLKSTIVFQKDAIIIESLEKDSYKTKLQKSEELRAEQQKQYQRLIALLKERNITVECREDTAACTDPDVMSDEGAASTPLFKRTQNIQSTTHLPIGNPKKVGLLKYNSLKINRTDRQNSETDIKLKTLKQCRKNSGENCEKNMMCQSLINKPTKSLTCSMNLDQNPRNRITYFEKVKCENQTDKK